MGAKLPTLEVARAVLAVPVPRRKLFASFACAHFISRLPASVCVLFPFCIIALGQVRRLAHFVRTAQIGSIIHAIAQNDAAIEWLLGTPQT
jgi:hypothetical protein